MPARSSLRVLGSVLAVALALAAGSMERAGAQGSTDLHAVSSAVYTVRPEAAQVDVRFTYRFDNPAGGASAPGFFERLPEEATALEATSGSGRLDVLLVGTSGGSTVWYVPFRTPLDPGRTLEVDLAWVLPDGSADSIVTDAAARFGAAAPGPEDALVTGVVVDVPERFSVSPASDPVLALPEIEGGYRRYDVTDPTGETAAMVAFVDPAAFVSRSFDGPPEITVADWTDDPLWADAVTDRVEAVLPELATWFGPRAERLEIRHGFRGSNHPATELTGERPWVAVFDDSAAAIDHQLAHAWLADVPVDEAWFTEGLAAAFAGDSPIEAERAAVIPPIVDEIGARGVSDVVDALRERTISYPGVDTEPQPLPADWRTLLDLLEEVGGSTTAASRFREVVDPGDVALLGA
ncbi:MAG: hypothetical protein R2695_06445 [Acidimicrobiales bacterium]